MHRGHADKVLAGVCAGLSDQLGIDTVIIRLFFGIAGLVSLGTVFWAYLLLWALMPERPGVISPAAKAMKKVKGWFTAGPTGQPTPE
ncbi:MAG: PspC domain-containing protein [Myxococcaceae bacterium]